LIAAARELQEINGRELTMSELQRIGQNQTADKVAEQYHILDNLLPEPFCVSLHYDDLNDPSIQQELRLVRGLARVWDNESAQSSQRGQFDAAGERSFLNVSLGSRMSVGGLLVHSLVGVAVESVGQQSLTKIRHDLSIDKAADLLRRLQRIESQRESFSTLVGRLNIWFDRIETWRFRVAFHAASFLSSRSPQENHSIAIIAPTIQAFEEAIRRRDTIHRLLMTELALRLYKHQKATHPNELADLVPAFLTSVPIDPYSGDPLIFRRTDENYLLYSVGRDGDDDGGKFGTSATTLDESYDFDIETLWRPNPIPTTATPRSSK
jgi:hypothetical protein